MKLVKFCMSDYNIMNCDKLFLGSYEKYRKIENPSIRDEMEARFLISVKLDRPTAVSKNWISALLNGTINHDPNRQPVPGRVSHETRLHNYHVIIMRGNEETVTLTANFDCFYSTKNSFIFCMSKYSDEQISPDPRYDSRWYLDGQESINAFGQYIANLISDYVYKDLMRSLPTKDWNKFSELKVSWSSGEVLYNAEERHFISKEKDMPLERFYDIAINAPFRKRKRFSAENEYRFVFNVEFGRYNFEYIKHDILLDSKELRKYARDGV